MVNQIENNTVECRNEIMKPFLGFHMHLETRFAQFLKPSVSTIDGVAPDFPANSLFSSYPNPQPDIRVTFKGWKHPERKWISWYEQMQPIYQPIWERAGIHHALKNSTYCIQQHENLILCFAERWCSKTQSFVFPWGESTITLEDVMILGGYPVLGNSILGHSQNIEEAGCNEILEQNRQHLVRVSPAKKAYQSAWLNKFAGSGSPIEHEAFLAHWLTRLVFPTTVDSVVSNVFPLAIRLARGEKIALAPALLASLYHDLTLLKTRISEGNGEGAPFITCAPFHLLQIWVWERFQALRPEPNFVENGEPRLARWDKKKRTIENVRFAIDSAPERFYWRPYVATNNNPVTRQFYKEQGEWIPVDEVESNTELHSFARCLRVCELVGIECTEHYLPHRVAMQFGFDQDVPGHVPRANQDHRIAWANYTRPIGDQMLYFPSRIDSATTREYFGWWWNSSRTDIRTTSTRRTRN